MISAHHLRAWQASSRARVVAIVDPDEQRRRTRAREFGVDGQYADVDTMLSAVQIDAIDIASPRDTHGPIIRKALDRRLAVLCQKPLVPTLADAESLVSTLDGRARVMVNQNFRFRPYYQVMSQWITSGRLGLITGSSINCRSSGLLPDATGRYPYIERQPFVRGERRLMIEEVLIHRLDIARWLCGPLEVVAARTRHGCADVVGESEATVFLQARDGFAVVVDGNFGAVGYPALSHDRVEIIGTRGRIEFNENVLRLFGPEPQEIRYEQAIAYQASFDATVAHFLDALVRGTPFLTDARDNLETIRLVEAAYRSAATRSE